MNWNEALQVTANFIEKADINTIVATAATVATITLAYISYRVLKQSNDINKRLFKIELSRNQPMLTISNEIFLDNEGKGEVFIKNVGGVTAIIEEVNISNDTSNELERLNVDRNKLTSGAKVKTNVSIDEKLLKNIDGILIGVRYRSGNEPECAYYDDRFRFKLKERKPSGSTVFFFEEKGPKDDKYIQIALE